MLFAALHTGGMGGAAVPHSLAGLPAGLPMVSQASPVVVSTSDNNGAGIYASAPIAAEQPVQQAMGIPGHYAAMTAGMGKC